MGVSESRHVMAMRDARSNTLTRVLDATAHLPTSDRLIVLQMAWLVLASTARTEPLPAIDGFVAEQARQVAALEQMLLWVQSDTPDYELERLAQTGDVDEMMAYLLNLHSKDRLS